MEGLTFCYICVFQIVYLAAMCSTFQPSTGQTTECIAPPPCTCLKSSVICSNEGLTEIPEFDVTDQTFDVLYIKLDGNSISYVPDNAFYNLTKTNCSDIRIDMSDNEITNLSDNSFADVENNITELQLQSNNLTALPRVLGSLRSLSSLSIFKNTIRYFDPVILQNLGLSLTNFRVGMAEDGTWPSGFRYLFELTKLTLQDVHSTSLPFDAFLGFEAMLTSLQIEFTSLSMVPTALCNLKYLQAFSFSYNDKLVDRLNIFPMCRPAISTLRTLVISYNQLIGFPSVFNTFPNVTTVRLKNNPDLQYIPESAVTSDSQLSNLDLSGNGFTQMPEALQRFVFLERLDLSNNKIISLEDQSVRSMDSLLWLSLSGNPLSYIADTAFRNISSLQTLILDNVNLTVFPRAVLTLPKLAFISFR